MMRIKSLLVVSLLFVGCTGTGRFTALKESEAAASAPKTFMIKEVAAKEGVRDPVNARIAKELEMQFTFALMDQGFIAAKTQPDLSIRIQIENISEGNAAVRYLLGPFLGTGEVTVLIQARDRDGKEWLSGEGEGTVTGGEWGGDVISTCKRIAVAYAKECRKRLNATANPAGT